MSDAEQSSYHAQLNRLGPAGQELRCDVFINPNTGSVTAIGDFELTREEELELLAMVSFDGVEDGEERELP